MDDTGSNTIDIDVVPANISHNSLANLTLGDPHTQYAYLNGRSGGQILNGGSASGENLTLLANSADLTGSIIVSTTTTSTTTTNGAQFWPVA